MSKYYRYVDAEGNLIIEQTDGCAIELADGLEGSTQAIETDFELAIAIKPEYKPGVVDG